MSKAAKEQLEKNTSLQLGLIHPASAGIDVGSMNMMVSYQNEYGQQIITETSAYTKDLQALAKDLKKAGVTHVAMEATGVYWMSIYEILEEYSISVTLVNARHYKNVAAQKTDVKDCQWLHQLHAHGLLKNSHIAEEQYRELKTYIHERGIMQNQKKDVLNRIQKVLTQMNIKLQHIISDIEGVTGMSIIRRIADGVDNAEQLLESVDTNKLKATKEELIRSLEGRFKPYYITVLKHHLQIYDFNKSKMLEYENLIEEVLKMMLPKDSKPIKAKTTKARKNQYHFNLKEYVEKIAGTDLTAIDGIDEISVLTIFSVTGLDLSKWRTAEHFVSWLNLSPRLKKSGGKILGHQKRFTNNAATQAFRLAAQSLWNSKTPLGHLFRRLSAQKGSKKAIKAVARRLAVIYYHMLLKKTTYDPAKTVLDEAKIKAKKIAWLQKEASKLGGRLEMVA
jgi:transposase